MFSLQSIKYLKKTCISKRSRKYKNLGIRQHTRQWKAQKKEHLMMLPWLNI